MQMIVRAEFLRANISFPWVYTAVQWGDLIWRVRTGPSNKSHPKLVDGREDANPKHFVRSCCPAHDAAPGTRGASFFLRCLAERHPESSFLDGHRDRGSDRSLLVHRRLFTTAPWPLNVAVENSRMGSFIGSAPSQSRLNRATRARTNRNFVGPRSSRREIR